MEFAEVFWVFDFELICFYFIFLPWKGAFSFKFQNFISENKLGMKGKRCKFHVMEEINELSLIIETLSLSDRFASLESGGHTLM